MYFFFSSPTFTNVIISDNSATYGGGMYLLSSSPTFTNVTFSGNSATYGGGILFLFNIHSGLDGSSPTLTNSILWGNSPDEIYFWEFESAGHSITISYSDIQGGEAGIVANDGTVYWEDGNIDADPLFCDAENGDLTIQSDSPLLGAGQDGTDMGAYGVGCEPFIAGDVTQDGLVNVLDIVLLVNWILSDTSLTDLEVSIADMTNDGLVNVLDIVALVNIILNP